MSWINAILMVFSGLAQADSFLRLDELHPKTIYYDFDGNQVEDQRNDYVYEPHLGNWFRTESTFDTLSGTWTTNYSEIIDFDPAANLVRIRFFFNGSNSSSFCHVYELDPVFLYPRKSFAVDSKGSCNTVLAKSAMIYHYGSQGEFLGDEMFYASNPGVFNWGHADVFSTLDYNSEGKLVREFAKSTETRAWNLDVYEYDSKGRLSTKSHSSGMNVGFKYVEKYTYESTYGDLIELDGLSEWNGVINTDYTKVIISYDPILLTKTEYSFAKQNALQPYNTVVSNYDSTGHLLKKTGYDSNGKVVSVFRYEY